MDPSRAGDSGKQQPGSDLPPDTGSASVDAAHGETEGVMTVYPSSALRESAKQAWPEWARAGESGRDMELRRTAEELQSSPTVIGWNSRRGPSRAPARGVTVPLGAAAVMAIAACTSVFVSLATVWLWGRTAAAVPVAPAMAPAMPPAVATVAPATKPPDPELTRAPLPAQPIGRPVRLAPVITAIKPDFPRPAFLAPPTRSRSAAPRAAAPRPAASRVAASRADAPRADAPRPAVTVPVGFVVTSEPAGANVTVNGVGYGPTPVTIPFLPPGARRIRVTKAGYESQEHVVRAEVAGSTPSVRIVLAELSAARGSQ